MSRGTNVAIVDSLWKDCCDCGYYVERLLHLWIFCGKIVVVDSLWNGFNLLNYFFSLSVNLLSENCLSKWLNLRTR